MMHAYKTEPNHSKTRNQTMTQPWLGENVYAEKRRDPMVPWVPDEGGRPQAQPVIKETKEDIK